MISIVVLNWNSGDYLQACLSSVERQTSRAWELVVVDNGSTNESLDVLEEFERRGVISTLIRLEVNVGFAQGMNVGFAHSSGELILALNSDACLAANFVEVVEAAALRVGRDNPKAGMFAVPLFDWEHSSVGDVYTDRLQAEAVTLVRRLTVNLWTQGVERREQLLGPGGAGPIFTRSALAAAEGYAGFVFDPEYFAYAEDIDLYIRLRALGFECHIIDGTRIWHIGSASVGQQLRLHHKPMRLRGMSHVNRWRTWRKIGGQKMRLGMLPWMILEDVLRVIAGPDRVRLAVTFLSNYRTVRASRPRRYPVVDIQFGGNMFSRSSWRATRGDRPSRYLPALASAGASGHESR
jgi:GT2 family glycosyltransferase